MKPEVPKTPAAPPQPLDELLNSAVVLNWDALTQLSTPARVRVEYHVGSDGGLEYLKMWNTGREYWSLICEYSTHLSWSDGPRFCNGYHSRSLARLLQSIMMNQGLCTHGHSPNTSAVLEISTPNAEEVEAAKLQVTETFQPAAPVRPSKRGLEVQLLPVQL